ncbi:SpoIIE family protein phosphatase [Streptomyces silvisoli]|uniref:SpoIIE family protein phosphatase n=1 Tax=Streptomyces silvisoli TaxID=3034235 RepID=A0ABT5ZUG4_9ACTN|nr:SpoIIE family protein phosphatase [Streptomyces silvisoli]MDF3293245.1 SpoIIE family protein phosphatase [Streptomyces silvisoli]
MKGCLRRFQTGRTPSRRRESLPNLRSAAGQVFVLQIVIVVLLVAAAAADLVVQAQRDATQQARGEAVAVAQTFAHGPGIVQALRGPNPTAALQPRAEAARKAVGVDFIVAMNTHGIRYTYPDPRQIGKPFVGTIVPALHGHTVVEQAGGPPLPGGKAGAGIQAVVPVTAPGGTVVGLVSAGDTVSDVAGLWKPQLPIVLGAGAAALALATAGTALTARRLRRQTHGLGPAQMTRMYEHHDAVLHAVREGVLITDAAGRLLLANDEARRLLALPADAEGRNVRELGLADDMAGLLASAKPVTDEVCRTRDRLLAINKRLTFPFGGPGGSAVTLRDTTELATVTGRAKMARERLSLLYESGTRIGTTLDVARTAQELAEVAVPRFADIVTVDLLDAALRGNEPAQQAHRRMRRTAVSGEREALPLYPVGELITFAADTPQIRALDRGRAVLETDLRQAAGWRQQDPQRSGPALERGLHSMVTVPLRARGVVLGVATFYRTGHTQPYDPEDASLAEELAARAAVCIDNARRFAREHTMVATLQRSLLPRDLPEQDALEVAWRYLPAESGVGGDWFDFIPLPGARVALVVGDVVGHGLHAAVTMGQLRTAVHNFAALDIPVDEVLGHLDELVQRMDSEETADQAREGHGPDGQRPHSMTGATCLYAIYDLATGTCTLARAGHPGPAVAYPDGRVAFPDVPASPPLGLGGPFETAELRLPEGSQLVLYTDGLIEDRTRDIDVGLAGLRRALQQAAGRAPDETCQAVIGALVPAHPTDDTALLVARTRTLDPSRVAEWDVPLDPAAVASARARCGETMRRWQLEEHGFTTELILSELVTNAIRYGAPPVRVRLLRQHSLICEVSDGSSTSPRLRWAATTDEGGRGLFLVAQFAQRWGTRYTPTGKVIWAEQPLTGEMPTAAADSSLADALLEQFDESDL